MLLTLFLQNLKKETQINLLISAQVFHEVKEGTELLQSRTIVPRALGPISEVRQYIKMLQQMSEKLEEDSWDPGAISTCCITVSLNKGHKSS